MTYSAKRTFSLSIGVFVLAAVVCLWLWPGDMYESGEGRAGTGTVGAMTLEKAGSVGAGFEASDRASVLAKSAYIVAVLETVQAKMGRWFELETGDDDGRARLLAEFNTLLTDENVAGVIQSLTPEQLRTPLGNCVLERWLDGDPSRATLWIAARADASEEQAWLVSRKLLGNSELLEVVCDQLASSPWKEQVLSGAALQAASGDPLRAIALAKRMEEGSEQTNIFETVAYDWTHREPEAALRWMMGVKNDALRERLLATGAKAIAASDPDLAAIWLTTAVKSDDVQQTTVLSVVDVWSAEDPRRAADWVAQLPVARQEAAADIVLRNWVRSDEQAATAWILRLPKGTKLLARWQEERRESQTLPEH